MTARTPAVGDIIKISVVDAEKAERSAKMRLAYQTAERRLKEAHHDEWNTLLTAAYAEEGLEVRRRLTDEEKEAREQARIAEKRAKLLAQLQALDGLDDSESTVIPMEVSA